MTRAAFGCRVLVLSPTRELATQIAESFRTYGAGEAISLVADDERSLLRDIQKVTRQTVPSFDRRNDRALGAMVAVEAQLEGEKRPSRPQPSHRPHQAKAQPSGQPHRNRRGGRPGNDQNRRSGGSADGGVRSGPQTRSWSPMEA